MKKVADALVQVVRSVDNPRIAVITPLYKGHDISLITQKTIMQNDIPFIWVSAKSENNIPMNLQDGLTFLHAGEGLPEYYIMIDRDIELGEHMLDKLYECIKNQLVDVALAYASFEFKGAVNMKFPALPWNTHRLRQGNYISSNSMFRSAVTLKVGLVTDNKYKRLLDWAFLLKLAKAGYRGAPCPEASFVAHSTANDISAGSREDYIKKHILVVKDFDGNYF